MSRSLALATVVGFATLALLSGWAAAERLRLDTSAKDLISRDLPYRQQAAEFDHDFPLATAPLIAVVQGHPPEQVRATADRLARRLRDRSDLFEQIYQPRGGAFFDRHALLYLPLDRLKRLSDRLVEGQPFLGRLTASPTVDELATLLVEMLDREAGDSVEALPALLIQMRDAIPAGQAASLQPLSWRALMFDDAGVQSDGTQVVQLWPQSGAESAPATARAIQAIHEAVSDIRDDASEVVVSVTGSAALEHDELMTAMRGMLIAGPLSVMLVAGLLFYAMRSGALVLASLLTLATGLLLTLGFATLAVGRLNLISIAFGVLYVGLGADFVIHLSLGVRAFRADGFPPRAALRRAMADVAGALSLCALTTMAGFFAFLPTSFIAVSELGLIAGAGMIINLVVTLTMLPALLTILPSRWRPPVPAGAAPLLPRLIHAPERRPRPVLALAGIVALAGIAWTPAARFDPDPLSLRDPESESMRALRELRDHSGADQWTVSAIAPNAEAAARLRERFAALPLVDRTVWLGSFVPDQQPEKMALLNDLSLVLGPALMSPATEPPPEIATEPVLETLRDLVSRLRATGEAAGTPPALASAAMGLAQPLDDWLDDTTQRPRAHQRLSRLREAWLGAFPLMVDQLRIALAPPGMITLENLPSSIRQRWISPDGGHRVEAFPQTDLSGDGEMRAFVEATGRVAPRRVGAPVSRVKSGDVIVRAFIEALSLATLAVLMIALLFFRSVVTMLEVVTPLLVGGLATVAVMAIVNEPFNFANVIALPLLFGVGADSGVHLVHRFRQGTHDLLLESATARGVFYSGLTTIAGFGSLAFSPHRGMASMGLVLTIGMVAILLSALVVLPALLAFRAKERSSPSPQTT